MCLHWWRTSLSLVKASNCSLSAYCWLRHANRRPSAAAAKIAPFRCIAMQRLSSLRSANRAFGSQPCGSNQAVVIDECESESSPVWCNVGLIIAVSVKNASLLSAVVFDST